MGLKLYEWGLEVTSFPYLRWGAGLQVLWGVNIQGGVQPVYLTVFRVWRSPGTFYVWFMEKWLLVLRQRRPWIYLEDTKQEGAEDGT